jgi:hypothetical protein
VVLRLRWCDMQGSKLRHQNEVDTNPTLRDLLAYSVGAQRLHSSGPFSLRSAPAAAVAGDGFQLVLIARWGEPPSPRSAHKVRSVVAPFASLTRRPTRERECMSNLNTAGGASGRPCL